MGGGGVLGRYQLIIIVFSMRTMRGLGGHSFRCFDYFRHFLIPVCQA